MREFLKMKVSLLLTIVFVLVSIGGTWGVTYALTRSETQQISKEDNKQKTTDDLYLAAVADAMIIEQDEILPVVSLEQGAPYALYDEQGRVLLLTFHKYPDSYPNGAEVTIEWGQVWTFTGGELADWYQKNQEGVTDWGTRLRQLIGLSPDNQSTHFTAMWVDPKNVIRPANIQDIGEISMTESLDENTEESFKEWFDSNIVWSYFDSAYPWTRLGYTYDWADNQQEYGLSEFLIQNNSGVQVAYTVTMEEMIEMLKDGSWKPNTSDDLQNAA